MKHLLMLVLPVLLLTACQGEASLQVGQPAPVFTGTDTAGNAVSLAGLKGNIVVLEWTNHDCPFVRKHYGSGNMQRQQREAAGQGVVWLSIISSAPGKQGHVEAAEADRLTRERQASPSAVLLDPEGSIGRLYHARTTPQMFIIDADGVLRYMGGIDSIQSSDPDDIPDAIQYVEVALAEMADGKVVSTPVSRPYGCSVKY